MDNENNNQYNYNYNNNNYNYNNYNNNVTVVPEKKAIVTKIVKIALSVLIDAVFLNLFFGLFMAAAEKEGYHWVKITHSFIIDLSNYLSPWWAAILFWCIAPAIPVLLIRHIIIPIGGRRKVGKTCMALAMVVPIVTSVSYFLIYRYVNRASSLGTIAQTLAAALFLFAPSVILAIITAYRFHKSGENM